MPHCASHRRHGFTLIEMAVVIVIIGLLLGSVVAGRSYIRNAEMTSLINESKFYINAFNQFQERYRAIPGDFAQASSQWPGAYNGDGNGILTTVPSTPPEYFYAFQHLNLAKLIEGSYTGATAGSNPAHIHAEPGTNIPVSVFPKAGYIFDYPGGNGTVGTAHGYFFTGLYGPLMRVAAITPYPDPGIPGQNITIPMHPLLTPEQALKLDTKFDDAKPSTGWITTPRSLSQCVTTNDAASAVYNTNVTAVSCYFLLRVQ